MEHVHIFDRFLFASSTEGPRIKGVYGCSIEGCKEREVIYGRTDEEIKMEHKMSEFKQDVIIMLLLMFIALGLPLIYLIIEVLK